MNAEEPRVIAVRQGEIRPSSSWLYVWMDAESGEIAYVGATGFDPELRAYLHLTSDDPDLGRVRTIVPQHQERNFDVLTFTLPEAVSRPQAKAALIARLSARGDVADEHVGADNLPSVIGPIMRALDSHRAAVRQESAASGPGTRPEG